MRYLIKPEPDIDFYALWCTNVDDFLQGGPRKAWSSQGAAPERFNRADTTGTSEIGLDVPAMYGWDCERFLLHRGTGNAWWLARTGGPGRDTRTHPPPLTASLPAE